MESVSKYVRNYRISKCQFKVPIEVQEDDIEEVVAFDNYFIAIIFDTGKIKIVDMFQKKVIETKVEFKLPIKTQSESEFFFPVKYGFAYDESTLGYINTTKRCLEFMNIKSLKFDCSLLQANIPTDAGLPPAECTDEKLSTLYRDGMKIVFLQETGYVCVLESKMVYNQNQNENIVTIFHKNQQNKHYKQVVFNQQVNKMLFLAACNKRDTIAVFGQTFIDQPISFFFWKITEEPRNDLALKQVTNSILMEISSISDDKLSLWGNVNQGNFPWIKIVDLKNLDKEEQTIQLDIFEGEQDSRSWSFSDIYCINYDQQQVIWERKSEEGTFMDVYNPTINTVTFSERIEENDEDDESDVEIYKAVTSSGKYVLGYNKDTDNSETPQNREISLVINSIVPVGTSLFHLMKNGTVDKHGNQTLYSKYGSDFVRNCINMLTKCD